MGEGIGEGDEAEQACRSRRDAGLRHHQRANGARTPTSPPSRNRANFSRDPEFSWHAPNGRRDRLAEPATMV